MAGWHHQFSGHEFEQGQMDSEGQGSPADCSQWGCMIEPLNNNREDRELIGI